MQLASRMRTKPDRRVLVGVVVVQVISAVLAWRDLAHRSQSRLRGPRRMWQIVILLNPGNSIVYWLVARRRSS